MEKLLNKINIIGGAAVTFLSAVLGRFWWAFVAFAALNAIDYITGVLKAKYYNRENSMAGVKGIIKKLGYWITIFIGFFISFAFIRLGAEVGVDFGFSQFIGWFVLITFLINEIRSILENLVQMDVELPPWLIKGLEVASDKINKAAGGEGNGKSQVLYRRTSVAAG